MRKVLRGVAGLLILSLVLVFSSGLVEAVELDKLDFFDPQGVISGTEQQTASFEMKTVIYHGFIDCNECLYEDHSYTVEGKSIQRTPVDGQGNLSPGNVKAETYAFGIIFEDSSRSAVRQIDVNGVESIAAAKTGEGEATAISEAFGIYLVNSDKNIIEHVSLGDVSSNAEATVETGSGSATAKALSAGVYLKDSNDNVFKHVGLGEVSAEATASADDEATAEEESYRFYVGSDSVGNTFIYSSLGEFEDKGEGTSLHFNDITGDWDYGVKNYTSEKMDLALNWWGSEDGPDYDGDDDGVDDYSGGGSEISGSASFAPWIKADPDASEEEPGVQPVSPLPILVRKVGPEPTTDNGNEGYLNKAIWGSNFVDVTGKVIVEHGNYPLTEKISGGLILISECGSSCKAIVDNSSRMTKEEKVTIAGGNVRIGKREGYSSRGFTFKEDIEIADEFVAEFGEVPRIPSFKRLAIIYEKQDQYADAIAVCDRALESGTTDGTNGGFEGRNNRLRKQLNDE